MDQEAVKRELMEKYPVLTAEPEPTADRFPRVDWAEVFARDFSEVDWLPGKFMERGQQVAIVGGGKVGKSLKVLDWVTRTATGERYLSDVRRDPLKVLYLDRENNLRDIVTRLRSLGAKPSGLDLLDYRSFPRFSGALDESPAAVAELFDLVDDSKPDIVIFDTVSRFIAGKENDSAPWLSFYRLVHLPLKERGIAGIRLDHTGKDEERGSRGSSAKRDDVDHVWELTKVGERSVIEKETGIETIITDLRMHRTYTRTGLGQDNIFITRRACRERDGAWLENRTRHELTNPGEARDHTATVQRHVDELIAKGAPGDLSRDKMRDFAKANGVKLPGNTQALADIAKALKAAKAP